MNVSQLIIALMPSIIEGLQLLAKTLEAIHQVHVDHLKAKAQAKADALGDSTNAPQ